MIEDNTDNKDNHDAEHEYDGIKELNNPSPIWIIMLFFITFGFAGIYAVKYFGHPGNGMDQDSEYLTAVKEQKMSMITGGKGSTLTEAQMKVAGGKLFQEKGCVACHGGHGEGNTIGPNLCDNYWISGCSPENVVLTIREGRPEKGMAPFKNSLSEAQINQLSVYILKSLQGSNPPDGKTAQGELCK